MEEGDKLRSISEIMKGRGEGFALSGESKPNIWGTIEKNAALYEAMSPAEKAASRFRFRIAPEEEPPQPIAAVREALEFYANCAWSDGADTARAALAALGEVEVDHRNDLVALEAECAAMEKRMNWTVEDNAKQRLTVADLTTELSTAQARVEELEGRLEAKTTLAETLGRQRDDARAAHDIACTELAALRAAQPAAVPPSAEASKAINFVCDGPPSHESGRFIEVEDDNGCGMKVGEWVKHRSVDGWWSLRVELPTPSAEAERIAGEMLAANEVLGGKTLTGKEEPTIYASDLVTWAARIRALSLPVGLSGDECRTLEKVADIYAVDFGDSDCLVTEIRALASRHTGDSA